MGDQTKSYICNNERMYTSPISPLT
jgi:hypothetical protein